MHAAVVETPPHDFVGAFTAFSSCSFLTEPEGIAVALAVRDECLHIANHRALRTSHGTPMSHDGFTGLNTESLDEAVQAIKEDWPQKTGASVIGGGVHLLVKQFCDTSRMHSMSG